MDTTARAGILFAILVAALAALTAACDSADETTTTTPPPTPTTTSVPVGDPTSTTAPVTTTAPPSVGSYEPPLPVTSLAGLAALEAAALDLSDAVYGSQVDSAAALDRFADGVILTDPFTAENALPGDYFGNQLSDATRTVEGTFITVNGAVFHVSTDMWPTEAAVPAGGPGTIQIDRYRFNDGHVAKYDILLSADTLVELEFGCFALDACPALQSIVDGYVAAWTTGDPDEIVELYHDDVVFVDRLLGIEASRPTELAEAAARRFGGGDFTFDVVAVYARTSGLEPPSANSPTGEHIVAVAIHYRIISPTDDTVLESLAIFELGAPHEAVAGQPDPVIIREEVFHRADNLIELAS